MKVIRVPSFSRFALLAFFTAVAVGALSPVARAQVALKSELVATGLTQPVGIYSIPGDNNRLFVVEKTGRIKIVDITTTPGTVAGTPFINLGSGGLALVSTNSERGLLGLAFDPNYTTNGHFYVFFTTTGTSYTLRIERFTATGAPFANQAAAFAASTANAASRLTMLSIPHPTFSNHNGGSLQFGPDGMLYAGVGDGGDANDPSENAQNLDVLLGKILRIDVNDQSASDGDAVYVPNDNPFRAAGGTIRPYIWAYGLRNPWRIDLDRDTGDLWIADVGQDTAEEVNFQARFIPGAGGNAAQVAGRNYGWDCREGFGAANGNPGDVGCVATATGYTDPIKVYLHNGDLACSITGGIVYRGAAIPELDGAYFHADYCGGWLRSFRYNSTTNAVTDLRDWTAQLNRSGITINGIVDFGEDAQGELYYSSVTLGRVYRIARDTETCGCPCSLPDDQVLLFSDNGQTNEGWTATIGVDVTDGGWQRGVPVNDATVAADPYSDSDGSGSAWLTANRAGNSDVDGGSVFLTSRTLDLSSGAAGGITLCYDYYIYITEVNGTDPDGLFVEMSSDNGSSWIRVASHITQNVTGWLSTTVTDAQLRAAGVSYTNQMRLRFIASDNNSPNQSTIECGVDAIKIYTTAEPPCACDFDSASGITADDIFAYLDAWFLQTGSTGTDLTADFNGDDAVTADDIFAFLDCWFTGCP